jgi:hypothetical protein
VAVAESSFVSLKAQLEDACASLRAFTLGRRGSTQRGGAAAATLVRTLCDQLKKDFPSGPHAVAAAALVTAGRYRVGAAEVRLALLKKMRR